MSRQLHMLITLVVSRKGRPNSFMDYEIVEFAMALNRATVSPSGKVFTRQAAQELNRKIKETFSDIYQFPLLAIR